MLVKRNMDEMITHFNDVVSAMDISIKDKMTILGMITAIGYEYQEAADAIEELRKDLERSKEYEAFWNKEAEEALRRFQVAVANKPRWIPVTEQCPEKSGDYLVFDDCRNLYVNEWHCLLKKWQYDDSRITHWQPLPEPPKEET